MRRGRDCQTLSHHLYTHLAEDFRTRRKMPQVARWSRHRLNGKTLRNPRASHPFGQLLSERRQRPDCQTLSHHSSTHKNLQVRRSSLRFTSGLHLLIILRAISIDQLLSPELHLTDHTSKSSSIATFRTIALGAEATIIHPRSKTCKCAAPPSALPQVFTF